MAADIDIQLVTARHRKCTSGIAALTSGIRRGIGTSLRPPNLQAHLGDTTRNSVGLCTAGIVEILRLGIHAIDCAHIDGTVSCDVRDIKSGTLMQQPQTIGVSIPQIADGKVVVGSHTRSSQHCGATARNGRIACHHWIGKCRGWEHLRILQPESDLVAIAVQRTRHRGRSRIRMGTAIVIYGRIRFGIDTPIIGARSGPRIVIHNHSHIVMAVKIERLIECNRHPAIAAAIHSAVIDHGRIRKVEPGAASGKRSLATHILEIDRPITVVIGAG